MKLESVLYIPTDTPAEGPWFFDRYVLQMQAFGFQQLMDLIRSHRPLSLHFAPTTQAVSMPAHLTLQPHTLQESAFRMAHQLRDVATGTVRPLSAATGQLLHQPQTQMFVQLQISRNVIAVPKPHLLFPGMSIWAGLVMIPQHCVHPPTIGVERRPH